MSAETHDGIGTTETQLDWTPWSVTEDVALDGTCSKRKRAFFKMALPRGLTILERSTVIAHPKPAPWHITTGVCNSVEIAAHVLDLNWSGYWFRHMCRAADILDIPCPDKRFVDDERPWNCWGQAIELKLKHRIKQIRCAEDIAPFYLGNRFPRTKENVRECSIPLPVESIALAQLAKQASQCDSHKSLVIPTVVQKYFRA